MKNFYCQFCETVFTQQRQQMMSYCWAIILLLSISAFSQIWVDDDWNNQADVDAFNTALTFGVDAFNTVQGGIDAAAAGNTVSVRPGSYSENITISSNLSLLSTDGRASTTITGTTDGSLGTIRVTGNTTAVQIGASGQGFTVNGIDNPAAGIESAAIYFQGSHSNAQIIDNEIVAAGDHGLLTEYGATISGFVIDGNEFSGTTFIPPNPAGDGFSQQFTLWNVPRQLVTMGGGSGGGNTSNITFTNNVISGTAGGINTGGNEQGNTLVTIDANGATITGNTFAGTTTRFGTSLRARGPATDISGNDFSSAGLSANNGHIYLQNIGSNASAVVAANTFDKGVYVDGPISFVGLTIGNFIAAVPGAIPAGSTIHVLAGTYSESVIHITASLTLQGEDKATTIVDAGGANGFYIDSDDVTLKDLTIQNASQAIRFEMASGTINNTTLDCVIMKDNTSRGIEIHNATTVTNLLVTGCRFENTNYGLRVSSSGHIDGAEFLNSVFINNIIGIYEANDGGTSTMKNVLIQGCTFDTNSSYGIFLEEIQDALIEGNTFTDNRRDIQIFKWYQASVKVSNVVIRNNVMTGTTNAVFAIFNAEHSSGQTEFDGVYFVNNFSDGNAGVYAGAHSSASGSGGIGWETVHVNDNCFLGILDPAWGVRFYNPGVAVGQELAGATIDALNNWWGTADGATVTALMQVPAITDFTPFRTVEADACGGPAHNFVLLADKRIKFKRHDFSEGKLHSNDRIEFQKGDPSSHTGDVTSVDRIDIREKNTIDGDVTSGDDIRLFGDANVTGSVTPDASVDEVALPSIPDFSNGNDNLDVAKGATGVLDGDYKTVKVQENGTLQVSSGEYNIFRLDMKKRTILEVDATAGPVIININNNLEVNDEAEMVIIGGNSNSITFNVAGSGVKLRKKSVWYGNIIAPDAKVDVQKEVFFQGTICASQIEIGRRSVVVFHGSAATPKTRTVELLAEADNLEMQLGSNIPTEYALDQNYPNPFNPTTTIRFALPEAATVQLRVFNIRGQLVRTLASANLEAGYHQIQWDATNENGVKVGSGMYFYQIQTKDFQQVKKMLLMK